MAKPKRSSNDQDENTLAFRIVAEATGQASAAPAPAPHKKHPYAVALGRKGGKKGGKARAESLSPERRREIAQAAAKARWGEKRG